MHLRESSDVFRYPFILDALGVYINFKRHSQESEYFGCVIAPNGNKPFLGIKPFNFGTIAKYPDIWYTCFMMKTNPKMFCRSYFTEELTPLHRKYIALRDFFVEDLSAAQVADKHGYTVSTVYSMTRDFRQELSCNEDPFFKTVNVGRKPIDHKGEIAELVVALRKKYLSVPDIQVALNSRGITLTIYTIEKILSDEGFARLHRRDKQERLDSNASAVQKFNAPIATRLRLQPEKFNTQLAGLLSVIPTILNYGIDKAIRESSYPQTKDLSRINSILSFVALKLSNIKRYSADDVWCMDRGMGLFAGLNVLPKAAWFSSYSSGVTRDMNVSFLHSLQEIWKAHGLLGDTANLDFSAIPYWGDDEHLENNWSGKRGKALAALQAVLSHDPDAGIILYGDTTIRHSTQSDTVLTFIDFYFADPNANNTLKCLVFDCRFTTFGNLDKINKREIKFITIRPRCPSLVKHIDSIDESKWKKVKVSKVKGIRTVRVYEEYKELSDYDGLVRHVYIKTNRLKPAIIITNDDKISLSELVRKYSRRRLIETEISEHIEFFHFNRNSSGVVIKVDFDLTMTILAHNVMMLYCKELEGYSHCKAETIFNKFISTPGEVTIGNATVGVTLKKKKSLPVLIQHLHSLGKSPVTWLDDFDISFGVGTTS